MGLHNAAELARQGRLPEAEAEVARLAEELQGDPEALHLQAQIAAQQGRLREAQGLWLRAFQIDPENLAYRKALDRVERDLALPRPLRRILPILLPLLASLVLLLAIYLGGRFLKDVGFQVDALSSQVSTLGTRVGLQRATAQAAATEQAAILGNISALKGSFATTVADASTSQEPRFQAIEKTQAAILGQLAPTIPSSIGLTTPGVTQVPGETELALVFDEGLFLASLELRPGAMDQLTQLGQELAPWSDRLRVQVVGYGSSDECLDCGTIPLAMQRATKVVEILTSPQVGLPEGDVVIGLQGQRPPPFPDTTDEDRLRNRTVVIVLLPRYP